MKIDDYFAHIQRVLRRPAIRDTVITFDRRSDTIGFIRGKAHFDDGHVLHLREYVDIEDGVRKYLYVYHLMNASGAQIFRYDNSGHHGDVSSSPHHRHATEGNPVTACDEPDLDFVLDEIEDCLDLA